MYRDGFRLEQNTIEKKDKNLGVKSQIFQKKCENYFFA